MLEPLFQLIFKLFGEAGGAVGAALLYLIVAYALWGFVWDRLLSKAGFKGKTYWGLFLVLLIPVMVPPLEKVISPGAMQALAGLSGLMIYGALWFIALARWPALAKTKSDRP